jgi:6-phosphogluconolactonase
VRYERITVVDVDRLPAVGAEIIADLLGDAIARRGHAALAAAGGHTPAPVYTCLAGRSLQWEHIDLFFGDERAVPPEDPQSNYRMLRDTLLDQLPHPPRRVYRMEAERPDLERAAEEYAAHLPPRLDLLVLGIGDDGHTASLFPRSPLLEEQTRRVMPASTPSGMSGPRRRLTITPPVIAAARDSLVIAGGKTKADPVRRALLESGDAHECPARLARDGRWLLDREAAAQLEAAP